MSDRFVATRAFAQWSSDSVSILYHSETRTLHVPLSGRLSIVRVQDEVAWETFPATGYTIKPDRRFSKSGTWTVARHGKLRRPANELIAYISGIWHYLGTYEFVSSEKFPPLVFRELSEQAQRRVVTLAGSKRRHDEIQSMLQDGEISMTKITFRRVGVNQGLWDFLASHVDLNTDGNQEEGGDDSEEMD
ncbi:hypothetical protein DAEQUDRAFT_674014 [Daedalea quercina L-15889]|uniref:Uncharacterized protein n=1 Tax=Daedalea quercina L-15889 TaxID=1314783 RepID=A0A165NIW4_9APHY|nr:hypothetical protein DAEQUDRAFT_674014 [Daedalea quercina L-15889]